MSIFLKLTVSGLAFIALASCGGGDDADYAFVIPPPRPSPVSDISANHVPEQPWWLDAEPVPIGVVPRVTQVPSDVLFAAGSAELSKAAETQLRGLLPLAKTNSHLVVCGHTDSDDDEVANQALSERRARAVADWLVGQGVLASKVESVGFGEAVPLVPNDSPSGKAWNRRVEIRFDASAAAQDCGV